MSYCGIPLQTAIRHYNLNINQVSSICNQILLGMMTAEILYEYEHRDLHVNNILVQKTNKSTIRYRIKSKTYKVTTYGIKAFIIDSTFSRMRIGHNVYYNHLSDTFYKLVSRFSNPRRRKKLSEQDLIYVKMFKISRENWSQWFPKTNNFWISFIIRHLLSNSHFKEQINKYEKSVDRLRMLSDSLLTCNCLEDILFVEHEKWNNLFEPK